MALKSNSSGFQENHNLLAVMPFVTHSCTLGAAAERLQQSTRSTLKDVLDQDDVSVTSLL